MTTSPTIDEPLTPDFYRYPWRPLVAAELQDRFIELEWAEGSTLVAYDYWLLENAVGIGVDPSTREGLLDPGDPSGPSPDQCLVQGVRVDEDGALTVIWRNGLSSTRYHPGWLHHVATGAHRPSGWVPDLVPWDRSSLHEPPTHDGPTVWADHGAWSAYLDDLVRFGLARLRDLTIDPDLGLDLGRRLGAVRSTNFGTIWDVRTDIPLDGDPTTNSTANTNLRLGPHTDLPTRETPPGFQFLHCIANTASGGASTMADGLAVVNHLRTEHPAHYDALTTLRWVFFNRGSGIDHRWSGPLVDLGVEGAPLTLRAFYPVRAFPDMAPADVPRAYAAMRAFSTLAASDDFQLRYPFAPGDVVGFDNRRILHGRDAYLSGGRRHLRGFYVDHDDVLSAVRVASRRVASA